MPRRGLQPGENNIANSTAKDHGKTPNKRGHTWSLQWYANINGVTKRHFTKVVDANKAEVYAAAVRRFNELMAMSALPGDGNWDKHKNMSAFVTTVCIPEVEANDYAKPLRPNSIIRYKYVLKLYAEQTKQLSIEEAVVPDTLQTCFKNIARNVGNATARQAAKVVSKYVMDILVRKQIISHNPLRPLTIEVTVRETNNSSYSKPKDGLMLLPNERQKVVDYLLEMDPAAPARKRWSSEVMTAKCACLIDMTLLQASTGLRISEVRHLTCNDVKDVNGRLTVTVTEEVSKTHRARTVPVFDKRVADRIRTRSRSASKTSSGLIFPRPSTDTMWCRRSAQKGLRSLYDKLADELGIPVLREVSTHVWRRTLNSEWADLGVSDARRAAYFGHSEEMNRSAYTDFLDLDELEVQVKDRMGGNE